MSKNRKILFIVPGVIVIGYILWTIIHHVPAKRQELLTNGKYSIATIEKFEEIIRYHSFFDRHVPVYTFPYKGSIYKGQGFGIIQHNSDYQLHETDIGKRYLVVFIPDDPKINSLLPYEEFTDTIPDLRFTNDSGKVVLIHPDYQKAVAPFNGWTKSERFGNNGIEHLELDLINYNQ